MSSAPIASRRAFLASGLAAMAAPAAVRAATPEDRGLLEVLGGYSALVVFSYELALHNAPLQSAQKEQVKKLSGQALATDDALRSALRRAGGTPIPRRPPIFTQLPPEIARKADAPAYVRYVVDKEQGLVNGFYATVEQLADPGLVSGACTFMAAAGRRLVALRDIAGLPLLPRAFETGGP